MSGESWQTYRLAASAPAGASGVMSLPIRQDARARGVRLWLPAGSQGMLQLVPYRAWRSERTNLVQFAPGGLQYLSGDDIDQDFSCDVRMEAGSSVCVAWTNTDRTNAHLWALDCTLHTVPGGGD